MKRHTGTGVLFHWALWVQGFAWVCYRQTDRQTATMLGKVGTAHGGAGRDKAFTFDGTNGPLGKLTSPGAALCLDYLFT